MLQDTVLYGHCSERFSYLWHWGIGPTSFIPHRSTNTPPPLPNSVIFPCSEGKIAVFPGKSLIALGKKAESEIFA